MRKREYVVIILILYFAATGNLTAELEASAVIPMPDLLKPQMIMSDETQLYVVERDAVLIYRWEDFRFMKKFGKRGEGPQEFNLSRMGRISFTVYPDKLIVYTYTKFLEYKKDGTFIREVRKQNLPKVKGGTSYTGNFYVFGNYYLLNSLAPGSKPFEDISFFLCDAKFNKIKMINRSRFPVNIKERKMYVYTPSIQPIIYKDMAFFPIGKKFEILGMSTEGKTFLHIEHDYEPVKVTKEHIDAYHQNFKTSHPNRNRYESRKKWWVFPEYFPAIRSIRVSDNLIYVQTYRTNQEMESEFLVFDFKGRYVRTMCLPVKPVKIYPSYPYLFKDGKFVQLIEDLDNETWNLHVISIK